MKNFTIKCHNCGDQNSIDDDEMSSVKIYFRRGVMPDTLDRLVFYCENCGNKIEQGIIWPLDINTPQPTQGPGG